MQAQLVLVISRGLLIILWFNDFYIGGVIILIVLRRVAGLLKYV